MTELVGRLRFCTMAHRRMNATNYADLFEKSADEIERLRAGIAEALEHLKSSAFSNAEHVRAVQALHDALGVSE